MRRLYRWGRMGIALIVAVAVPRSRGAVGDAHTVVVSRDPSRRLRQVPLATGQAPPQRHETVLPPEPAEAEVALEAALRDPDRGSALRAVVARWPAFLDGWARLGQATLATGDLAAAYAFARVGYHRGLDRLRKHGWGGVGLVRWAQPTNRGFLRSLQLLLVTAAALGELEESTRCRQFLLDLDPDDALGISAYPETPGPGWQPPSLP